MPTPKEQNDVKRIQRLREPIILIDALSSFCQRTSVMRQPAVLTPLSDQEVFQRFVYKLALVCDCKSAETITAVSIMEDEESYCFLFACNQVSLIEGESVARHITDLLTDAASEGVSRLRKVRRRIFLFNRKRIEKYVKYMSLHASALCDNTDHVSGGDDSWRSYILAVVSSVKGLEKFEDDEYLQACYTSIRGIEALFKQSILKDRSTPNGAFEELKHTFSRLRAYEDAALCIADAATRWPDIFQFHRVQHVPSKAAKLLPLGKRSHSSRSIIGRMSNHAAEISDLRAKAETLILCDLDAAIKHRAKESKRLTVHCEVVLEDWILHSREAMALRFFQGWKYIGASKPTCRLCKYYFEVKGSDISLRPSHDNLYTNWAFPEISGPEESLEGRAWQDTHNAFMRKIRSEAIRMLTERTALWKKHDSNTYGTPSMRSVSPAAFGAWSRAGGQEKPMMVQIVTQLENTSLAEDSDEEGGVSLK